MRERERQKEGSERRERRKKGAMGERERRDWREKERNTFRAITSDVIGYNRR